MLLTSVGASQPACSTTTCPLIAVNYEIAMERDTDAAFQDSAKFAVEVCFDQGRQCRAATVSPISHELVGTGLRGNMVALDRGRTRVRAVFQVVENDATSVTLRVRDANGNLVLDARAPLEWRSDECHGTPVTTSI